MVPKRKAVKRWDETDDSVQKEITNVHISFRKNKKSFRKGRSPANARKGPPAVLKSTPRRTI